MKKIIYFATTFIILSFYYSCKSNSDMIFDGNEVMVDLKKSTETIDASIFINNIEKVRIELPQDYILGRANKILFTEDFFFICDGLQDKLLRFSKEGEFLNNIGNIGNGPGEYTKISSCSVGYDYIYILDVNSRKINKYNFNGEFLKSITFPMSIVFDSFMVFENDTFLCYSPSSLHEDSGGAWLMNSEGERIKDILSPETQYPFFFTEWDNLYHIDENTIGLYYPSTSTHYSLNLENYELTETFKQSTNSKMAIDYPNVGNINTIKKDFDYCPMSIEAENWIFSLWDSSDDGVYFTLYSKHEKSNQTFRMVNIDIPGYNYFSLPIDNNLTNHIVNIITDELSAEFFPDEDQNIGINPGTAIIQIMEFK